MSGRATTLGLALALAAWAGPAHAWAPESPVVEDAEPGIERGGEAEPPIDTAEAEAEAAGEPPLADGEEGTAPSPDAPSPATDEPSSTAPVPTHDVPADDFEAETGLAPGGYYGHGVILERPPPDGRNRIIAGSILVPLGTIATISSAVGTWMTVPAHCAERLGAAGIEATASRCQGLFTFNVIRTTYGTLMLASGTTILVLGLIQREKHRKWRHEHGMRARLDPVIGLPGRGTASLGLRLRF